MPIDVVVPEVGEVGMDVTLARWLKAPGDEVRVGDVLFEIDTAKTVVDIEAFADGTLLERLVDEGDIVTPRQVVARIMPPGERLAFDASEALAGPAASTPAATAVSDPVPASPVAISQPRHSAPGASASPKARRVAAELGVELEGIVGSGPNGLVTEGDVRKRASDASRTAGTAPSREPLDDDGRVERARRATAEITTRSWTSTPHYYIGVEVDVTGALQTSKPTVAIVAGFAQALAAHPECNIRWDGTAVVPRGSIDIGVLVDTPTGLMVAVVRDADRLDLAETAEAVRAAVARARTHALNPADAGPRSMTISNLGMHSVDRFAAVLVPPDALTLAVGRVRMAPRWDGTAFQPRQVVDLTLSVDHRALDGAVAARLLSSLERILTDPAGALR